MKQNDLTPYDEFMICKNKDVSEFSAKEDYVREQEITAREPKLSPAYKKYLKKQLRRTKPSDEKVMTQEEFADRSVRMVRISQEERDTHTEGEVATKSVRFKKFGKFMLCGYVIIMLALTLIVVVKTTTVDNTTSADASDAYVDSASKIEKMQDEESEENDNWFDSLCDSLK